jgi:DNA polymerase-1
MNDSVYVLDSYGLIYRSYFAFIKRPLTSPSGANVSAIYGFFRSIFALMAREKPEYLLAAMDSRVPTFRHELYAEYKATRQKTPEDLHAQVPVVEEILAKLGIPIARADGYEADDLIATIARACEKEGRPCRVISGDKDLLQLVGGKTRVLQPDKALEWIDMGEAEVEAVWGVPPARILDYLSLTGDSSDNIPGVSGVGDKTACKLISEFGSLDAIYANLAAVKPEGTRKKLEAGRESAFFSRKLVTLAYDAPAPAIADCSLARFDRSGADAEFKSLGMASLIKSARTGHGDPGAASAADSGDGSGATAAFATSSAARAIERLPVRTYLHESEYRALTDVAELRTYLAEARSIGAVAFDCETNSLDEERARLIGFSLSKRPGEAVYAPLFSPDGKALPQSEALAALSEAFSDPNLLVVGQNLKFDARILSRRGVPTPARIFDTMVAAWMLDSSRDRFDLGSLALACLGRKGIAFDEIVAKGSDFSSVPIGKATAYACEDADFALCLREAFEPALEAAGLRELFDRIEMPLVPILASLESVGMRLDSAALEAFGRELDDKIAEVERKAKGLAGRDFNLASPKQLAEILFVERKLKPVKTTKSGYSTDESVLRELAREDPLAELMLSFRSMSKLKGTYVTGLVDQAGSDGVIRTRFAQTGTETGRLSSRDPNLQNIPIRDDEGRRIRDAFVAREGMTLISADYSQIELVVLAHLSGDPGLSRAFADGVDVHRRTAALIHGLGEADVSAAQRRAAKAINFGVIYGMSAFRLSDELGIGRGEAQRFIDAYFAAYSGVKDFIARTIAEATESGYARTILGRRRPVPDLRSRNKNERQAGERVAVNTTIQGSAADIVKLAMVKVHAALARELPDARMLLQVHDELIVEAPDGSADAAAALMAREMEGAIRLSVPLRASVEQGKRWGAMH